MEEIGTVSLWLGTTDSVESLNSFLRLHYSEDGDFEGSDFTRHFDIQYYEEDFMESEYIEKSNQLATILRGFSYEEIIVPQFSSLLGPQLIDEINVVVLLYNFKYSGAKMDMEFNQVRLKFMGVMKFK